MTLHVNNAGIWTPAKKVWARDASVWKEVAKVWVMSGGVWRLAYQNVINVTISNSVANFNLASAIGNPTTPVNVNVLVPAGVNVVSSNINLPAFTTGDLPAGSVVTLTVQAGAAIVGRGGRGASYFAGGTSNPSIASGVPAANRYPAQNGGDAIEAKCQMTINNSGTIGGGGGGGVPGGIPEVVTAAGSYARAIVSLTEFRGGADWTGPIYNGNLTLAYLGNAEVAWTYDALGNFTEVWKYQGGSGAGGSDAHELTGNFTAQYNITSKDGSAAGTYGVQLRVFGAQSTLFAPTPIGIPAGSLATPPAGSRYLVVSVEASIADWGGVYATGLTDAVRPNMRVPAGGGLGQDGVCVIDGFGPPLLNNGGNLSLVSTRTIPAGRAGRAVVRNGNTVTVNGNAVLGAIV